MAPTGFLSFAPSCGVLTRFLPFVAQAGFTRLFALVAQTGLTRFLALVTHTGLTRFPRFLVLLSLTSFMLVAISIFVVIAVLGKCVTDQKSHANHQHHEARPNSCVHAFPPACYIAFPKPESNTQECMYYLEFADS